jgi:hypothetical protein
MVTSHAASFNPFQRVTGASQISQPLSPNISDGYRDKKRKSNEEFTNPMAAFEDPPSDAGQQKEGEDGGYYQIHEAPHEGYLLSLHGTPDAAQKITLAYVIAIIERTGVVNPHLRDGSEKTFTGELRMEDHFPIARGQYLLMIEKFFASIGNVRTV